MSNSKETDLFNTNEDLDLLHILKQNKARKEREAVEELEQFMKQRSVESSIQKSIDSSSINSAFKSLNSKMSSVQNKLNDFNKMTSENSDNIQFINVKCPLGLNLSEAFQDVMHLKENDVDKILENFCQENMKAMVSEWKVGTS